MAKERAFPALRKILLVKQWSLRVERLALPLLLLLGCSQKPLFGRSQEPMYGTRPWCLVQAITQHTCPDPHLGSWNCLPHQAHIAPSEPMSSTDQQGSSLDSFPTFPPPYTHFNRPLGFWPCVKSCLVGGSDKYSLLLLGRPRVTLPTVAAFTEHIY